jgi:hypothetical protein
MKKMLEDAPGLIRQQLAAVHELSKGEMIIGIVVVVVA